jgi:hypothetical protein
MGKEEGKEEDGDGGLWSGQDSGYVRKWGREFNRGR